MSDKISIGLIGCGYWGANYVRLINDSSEAHLRYIYDLREPSTSKIRLDSATKVTKNLEDMLNDLDLQAVIIATNAKTHYEIARKALCSGKDVLVEKPMTLNSDHSKELIDIAENKRKILMVGHIFEYNESFRKLKEKVRSGEIGDLRYIHAERLALGPIRTDAGALWDLASHDIYMTTSIFGKLPEKVSCSGASFNSFVDDINNLSLSFQEGFFASIYANWHYPTKVRTFIVAGSKKAVLFDDTQPSNKLKIYDVCVSFDKIENPLANFAAFNATLREGDIYIPKIKITQPLEEQLKHFISCIKNRQNPLTDGLAGYRTVKILEAAQTSRENGGKEIYIKWP